MKNRWATRALGNVCERVTVGHVGITSPYYRDEGILFLRTQNVGKEGLVLDDRKYITPAFHTSLKKSSVKSGDLLMSRVITHTVHCALIPPDLGPANCANVILVRPASELLPAFLAYYIRSSEAQQHLLDRKVGSAQLVVNTTVVQNWPIPVPPLSEQQRIVGILDDASEGIATAKANAEKNLQNARALFESHLQSVFADAFRSCRLVRLSDLATDITDGDHMPPPKSLTGVPFITIGNIVKQTRKIDFADTFMVPYTYFNGLKPNKKPKNGDVLYTVTGSFGIPVVVGENIEFCFQRHIGLVRPKSDVNSAWLYYLLLSSQIFKQACDGATGTAQKTVSLKLLRGFEVPKPTPKQQQIAVAKLDSISTETQRLESIYQQKLTALEALKKSLLHQAFIGQL